MAQMPDEPAPEGVPPATPISRLQEIGRELEIDATLLSVDALMVDPPTAVSTNSDD